MGKKIRKKYVQESSEEEDYIVEKILSRRIAFGKEEYLLKWEGYGPEFNTWEPIENLDCENLIADFKEQEKLTKPGQSTSKEELNAKNANMFKLRCVHKMSDTDTHSNQRESSSQSSHMNKQDDSLFSEANLSGNHKSNVTKTIRKLGKKKDVRKEKVKQDESDYEDDNDNEVEEEDINLNKKRGLISTRVSGRKTKTKIRKLMVEQTTASQSLNKVNLRQDDEKVKVDTQEDENGERKKRKRVRKSDYSKESADIESSKMGRKSKRLAYKKRDYLVSKLVEEKEEEESEKLKKRRNAKNQENNVLEPDKLSASATKSKRKLKKMLSKSEVSTDDESSSEKNEDIERDEKRKNNESTHHLDDALNTGKASSKKSNKKKAAKISGDNFLRKNKSNLVKKSAQDKGKLESEQDEEEKKEKDQNSNLTNDETKEFSNSSENHKKDNLQANSHDNFCFSDKTVDEQDMNASTEDEAEKEVGEEEEVEEEQDKTEVEEKKEDEEEGEEVDEKKDQEIEKEKNETKELSKRSKVRSKDKNTEREEVNKFKVSVNKQTAEAQANVEVESVMNQNSIKKLHSNQSNTKDLISIDKEESNNVSYYEEQVKEIITVGMFQNGLQFLVAFKDLKLPRKVPCKEAYKHFPQAVIAFFESIIKWKY